MNSPKPLEKILDLARWAPSGDNTQPWRFHIVNESHVEVHGFDTRHHCVYDLDGRPSQIALGALLETVVIAASEQSLRVDISRRPHGIEEAPVFDLRFSADPTQMSDPLLPYITLRTVQRRRMSSRRLYESEKSALARACGADYQLLWFEGRGTKWAWARVLSQFAKLRLTMPEAYAVHAQVIAWNARFSEDKVPDQAVGLDPMTLRLMRWVMKSWGRVKFFNTFLAGTLMPRLQLELLPAMACAAHFIIYAKREPAGIDDYVAAGRALQRFWLTATQLGLQMQPEMTPLIFSRYVRDGLSFTKNQAIARHTKRLTRQLEGLVGDMRQAVFMGRIGAGPAARARSLRLSLLRLRV